MMGEKRQYLNGQSSEGVDNGLSDNVKSARRIRSRIVRSNHYCEYDSCGHCGEEIFHYNIIKHCPMCDGEISGGVEIIGETSKELLQYDVMWTLSIIGAFIGGFILAWIIYT